MRAKSLRKWGIVLSGTMLLGACGPVEQSAITPSHGSNRPTGLSSNGLSSNGLSSNGLSSNGLSSNGLSSNGLSSNGLSSNGLSSNGLSSNGVDSDASAGGTGGTAFDAWFDEDPAQRAMVMSYIVRCAVPAGETRPYRDSAGQDYVWQGSLGLAPDWAAGAPATLRERQLVSACLGAHVNAFGEHVSISVLGLDARSEPLAYTPEELTSHPVREACFFGDLEEGGTLFVGNDGATVEQGEAARRVCGVAAEDGSSRCPPMVHVGRCADHCTLDPTGTFYVECSAGGTQYPAITTRIVAEAP